MRVGKRLITPRLDSRAYTLVEALIAAAIFTGVFLMMFTLLSRAIVTFSGSDLIRGAQIAEECLTTFQARGRLAAERVVAVDSVHFAVRTKTETTEDLAKLWVTVIRKGTGDTVAAFYTERYEPKTTD